PWDIWLIFLLLGVVVPWRGRLRLRELLDKPSVGSNERLALYASTILFQWTAAAIAAWRAWAHGLRIEQLGLSAANRWEIILVAIAGAVVIGALQWLNLRRMGRMTTRIGHLRALAERILPQSPKEIVLFSALAVTAGICEEFLYRGFAMASLTRAGLPTWSVVVISSILFGLAHLYQGRAGLVGTIALGLLFGTARILCNSLGAVVAWHSAVDLVAGVAGPKYLVQRGLSAAEPVRGEQ